MPDRLDRAAVRRGFLAVLPFWPGAVPFAAAFALLSGEAGFSGLETQAWSMLVFAGASQLAGVALYDDGAGVLTILLTAVALNLRHVLYGLSLSAYLPSKPRPRQALLAVTMVDETYGLTVREALTGNRDRRALAPFLLGAGVSLYLVFALATLTGTLLGGVVPDVSTLGLGFIFPITFLALLLPLVRGQRHLVVAVIAAGLGLLLEPIIGGGLAILVAAASAAGIGVALDERWPTAIGGEAES